MNSAENHQPASDDDLMKGIVRGEEDALSELYERYGKIVFAVCMRALRDRIAAEEVTQKVFWEVWDRCERYDSTRGAVQAYVLTIARSRSIDWLRSKKPRMEEANQVHLDSIPMMGLDGVDPSDQIANEEWRIHVRKCVEELDSSQREAIEMAFYEGLTHRQVAEQLNRPLGTVKAHIRKGLMKLAPCLDKFSK